MCATKQRIADLNNKLHNHLEMFGNHWAPNRHRLLGAPSLLSSEAFSSWCWRIAARARIPIRAVLGSFGLRIPSFWVDSGRVELDLGRIAAVTMSSTDALEHFRWLQSSLLSKRKFSCLTTEPANQVPIYRYCELCLREDRIPYIRRLWRLAFAFVCPTHGNILRDHCPCCHTRLDFSQDRFKVSRSIRLCTNCGADLCVTTPVFLPDHLFCDVMAQQVELLRLVSSHSDPPHHAYWHEPRQSANLTKVASDVIDPFSPENVRALFGMLLETYVEGHRRESTLLDCSQEIGAKLCSVRLTQARGPAAAIAIGLSGRAMFLGKAAQIGAHLKPCQCLFEGTYWWPLTRGVPFETRLTLIESTLARAYRWTSELGRSKTSYNHRRKRSTNKVRSK